MFTPIWKAVRPVVPKVGGIIAGAITQNPAAAMIVERGLQTVIGNSSSARGDGSSEIPLPIPATEEQHAAGGKTLSCPDCKLTFTRAEVVAQNTEVRRYMIAEFSRKKEVTVTANHYVSFICTECGHFFDPLILRNVLRSPAARRLEFEPVASEPNSRAVAPKRPRDEEPSSPPPAEVNVFLPPSLPLPLPVPEEQHAISFPSITADEIKAGINPAWVFIVTGPDPLGSLWDQGVTTSMVLNYFDANPFEYRAYKAKTQWDVIMSCSWRKIAAEEQKASSEASEPLPAPATEEHFASSMEDDQERARREFAEAQLLAGGSSNSDAKMLESPTVDNQENDNLPNVDREVKIVDNEEFKLELERKSAVKVFCADDFGGNTQGLAYVRTRARRCLQDPKINLIAHFTPNQILKRSDLSGSLAFNWAHFPTVRDRVVTQLTVTASVAPFRNVYDKWLFAKTGYYPYYEIIHNTSRNAGGGQTVGEKVWLMTHLSNVFGGPPLVKIIGDEGIEAVRKLVTGCAFDISSHTLEYTSKTLAILDEKKGIYNTKEATVARVTTHGGPAQDVYLTFHGILKVGQNVAIVIKDTSFCAAVEAALTTWNPGVTVLHSGAFSQSHKVFGCVFAPVSDVAVKTQVLDELNKDDSPAYSFYSRYGALLSYASPQFDRLKGGLLNFGKMAPKAGNNVQCYSSDQLLLGLLSFSHHIVSMVNPAPTLPDEWKALKPTDVIRNVINPLVKRYVDAYPEDKDNPAAKQNFQRGALAAVKSFFDSAQALDNLANWWNLEPGVALANRMLNFQANAINFIGAKGKQLLPGESKPEKSKVRVERAVKIFFKVYPDSGQMYTSYDSLRTAVDSAGDLGIPGYKWSSRAKWSDAELARYAGAVTAESNVREKEANKRAAKAAEESAKERKRLAAAKGSSGGPIDVDKELEKLTRGSSSSSSGSKKPRSAP